MSRKNVSKKKGDKNAIQSISPNDFMPTASEKRPRVYWEEAFIEMHKMGDDRLRIDSVLLPDEWQ